MPSIVGGDQNHPVYDPDAELAENEFEQLGKLYTVQFELGRVHVSNADGREQFMPLHPPKGAVQLPKVVSDYIEEKMKSTIVADSMLDAHQAFDYQKLENSVGSKIDQDEFDMFIGRMDHTLSKMIRYSKSDLRPDNRQTLKHHAEDMILASVKCLENLKIDLDDCGPLKNLLDTIRDI